MVSATLENLPTETILAIVRFAGDGHSYEARQTLYYKLCLVKPLAPSATELLYEEIDLHEIHSRPQLLVRTYLQHPALGQLLRVLKIRDDSPCAWHFTLVEDQLLKYTKMLRDREALPHRLSTISDALEYFTSNWKDVDIMEGLVSRRCLWALSISLLLLCSPNISTMQLEYHDSKSCESWLSLRALSFLPLEKNIAPALTAAYSKVKIIRFANCDIDADILAVVFRLGSLKHLEISGLLMDSFESAVLSLNSSCSLEARMSPIETLRICSGELNGNEVAYLIRCCKQLRELSYCASGGVLSDDLCIVPIHAALLAHRDTLRTLELINLGMYVEPQDTWCEFKSLRYFRMDSKGIPEYQKQFGLAEFLPRNLECLGIDASVDDRLIKIIRAKNDNIVKAKKIVSSIVDTQSFPSLQHIKFDISRDHWMTWTEIPACQSVELGNPKGRTVVLETNVRIWSMNGHSEAWHDC